MILLVWLYEFQLIWCICPQSRDFLGDVNADDKQGVLLDDDTVEFTIFYIFREVKKIPPYSLSNTGLI